MKCKLTYIAVIFLSIIVVSSCKLVVKDYYVSPQGDDNEKGNARHPWKTINYAVSQVNSGTIHILEGAYKEVVNISNSGSADNLIIIKGEEGAIIDGSFGYNFPGKGLFTIENANYIIVDGITIKNALTHGIMVKGDCSNIQIRNCRTEHTRGSGIYVYGEWPFTGYHINNVIIENNEIHWPQEGFWDRNNVWQEDITLCGGIENFIIRSNYINAYDTVREEPGPSGICIKSGVRNGEIYNNTIENIPGSGIQLNAGKTEIRNIEVYKNLIKHVTNFGILVGAIEGGAIDSVNLCYNIITRSDWSAIACSDYNKSTNTLQPKTNIDIFNNTIYRPGKNNVFGNGFGIYTQNSYAGKIYNNIIAGCKDDGMKLSNPDLNVTNNCLFNKDNGNIGANAIISDPQFVDPSGCDFSLKSTSPCIETGVNYESLGIDVYTIGRAPGNTYDIGANDSKFNPTNE